MEYADRCRAWEAARDDFLHALARIKRHANSIRPTYGKGPDHRAEVLAQLSEFELHVEEARKKLIDV